MQRIRMTRSLITEMTRCPKSFVLSLFHHGLDNDTLAAHGGVLPDSEPTYNARRDMICGCKGIAAALANAKQVVQIDCSGEGMQEKLDQTWEALSSGEPTVIFDGALEGGDFVVPFSILVVRSDGLWEVYHQSTKTLDHGLQVKKDMHYMVVTDENGDPVYDENGEQVEKLFDLPVKSTLNDALSDAAPLMYVLSHYYPDYVAKFCVIGADKTYVMPYPDPRTGEITVSPDDAIYDLELDSSDIQWSQYLGANDPMSIVHELQEQLSQNPFWLPDAQMGGQCGASRTGFDCPYKVYCTREMEEGAPNHLKFHLPYHDYNKLQKLGYETMDDLLELSYYFPTGEQMPAMTSDEFYGMAQAGALGCLRYFTCEKKKMRNSGEIVDVGKPCWRLIPEEALDLPDEELILIELDEDDSFLSNYPMYTCIDLSDIAMRELRSYEMSLLETEKAVRNYLS